MSSRRHRSPAHRSAILAWAACLAATAPAWAGQANGFGVSTSATVGDPYPFIWARSAYRTLGDSSGNLTLTADAPPVLDDPCPALQGSGFFCSAGLVGTNAPGYDLTSARNQATLTTSLVANSAELLTASASSHADLASATLGVAASTGYRQGAQAFASFTDTLRFQVAGAGPSTTTLVTVHLTLDGALSAPSGIASIDDMLQFGNASARASYTVYGAAYGSNSSASNTQGGWVSFAWGASTPGLTRFTGVYALQGDAPEVGLSHRLIGIASNHVADSLYGNTSALQLDLPQGVSVTSASGVFLTSAVPEPATTALWALGLGGLGLLARRRRGA